MLGPLEPPSLEHALPKLTHITPRNDNARSAILSTLSLLDFRISDWFPSGPSNTESEDMVLQLFPGKSFAANPKVFEAVTYFLFTKLDKERARDVFRTCWPIFDRSQAREFRNTVVKALEMMKKDGVLPQTLLIRRSCFDDLRGERYEQTLLSLAVHVLNTVMSREYSSSVDDPFLHMDLSRKHDHHVLLQCLEKLDAFSKEFGALQDLRHSTEQEWIKYGQEITHAFEEVTRDMTALNERADILRQEDELLWSTSLESLTRKHEEEIEKSQRLWDATIDWVLENSDTFDNIKHILTAHSEPTTVDVTAFHMDVPEELVRLVELRNGNFGMYTSDGELDFSNVFQLSHVLAKRLAAELKKVATLDLGPLRDTVLGEVSACRGRLNEAGAKEAALRDELMELQEAITSLRLSRKEQMRTVDVELQPPKPIVPKTPRFKLGAADRHLRREGGIEMSVRKDKKGKTPSKDRGLATPAAISKISKDIRNKQNLESKVADFHVALSLSEMKTPARKPKPNVFDRLQESGKRTLGAGRATPIAGSTMLPSKLKSGVKNLSSNVKLKTERGKSNSLKSSVKSVADQIVDAIYSESSSNIAKTPKTISKGIKVRFDEKSHAASNPLAALGNQAFQPRAELGRTPLKPKGTPSYSTAKKTPGRRDIHVTPRATSRFTLQRDEEEEEDNDGALNFGLDEKSIFYEDVFGRDSFREDDLLGEDVPNFLVQDGPDDYQSQELFAEKGPSLFDDNDDTDWITERVGPGNGNDELLDLYGDWAGVQQHSVAGLDTIQGSIDFRDTGFLVTNPSLSFDSVQGPDFWEHQDSAIAKSEVMEVPAGHPDPSSVFDVQSGGSLVPVVAVGQVEEVSELVESGTDLDTGTFLVEEMGAVEGRPSVFLDGFLAWNEAQSV